MLPASGLTLHVREATGADELIVLEPGWSPVATLITLASRLATDAQGRTPAWEELPAADAGAIALTIRQAWLGERISTDARCLRPGCLERMDIAFVIPAYLAHHRRRPYAGMRPGQDAGWFELGAAPVSFRLPTIGDLRAAMASADPEHCLRERCVRPATVPAATARRVSRAMIALAPSLSGTVTVCCPACGDSSQLRFDPVSYSLTELREAAAGLYEEVHLLASAFRWPEDAILALPRSRRARYAELIRRDRAAA
ncbi:MAG TPA: hypothetical protein VFO01_06410 [Trebonia sp.]|nr:hypothetical protein [Trebonia sp.]